MKYLICISILLGSVFSSLACGNEFGYKIDGTKLYTRYFFISDRMWHFDTNMVEERISELSEKIKSGEANHTTWSDLAANLMKIGKADSAIVILIDLIKEHADLYNIVANLGTAYELTGELDSALKYISLGYKIHPRSHARSEWIHIEILKAKIKERDDNDWMYNNEIVGLNEMLDELEDEFRNSQIQNANKQFMYQVRTRIQFTSKPDVVIANLLETLGDYNLEVGTYENALLSYAYATQFQDNARKKVILYDKIRDLNRKRDSSMGDQEIPAIFVSMMRRSKLNPNVLTMGLDEYAEQLDYMHLWELNQLDSIAELNHNIDSISNVVKIRNDTIDKNRSHWDVMNFVMVLLGLVIGSLITLILKKK